MNDTRRTGMPTCVECGAQMRERLRIRENTRRPTDTRLSASLTHALQSGIMQSHNDIFTFFRNLIGRDIFDVIVSGEEFIPALTGVDHAHQHKHKGAGKAG